MTILEATIRQKDNRYTISIINLPVDGVGESEEEAQETTLVTLYFYLVLVYTKTQ